MIEVHNVTKYYGQVRALHQVSFDVREGEIVGLLGPNGSGKTTLMRILTGFFPPTEGRVVVAGYDVETASLEMRRKLGYLAENVVLYPDMTVRAFLGFCARVKTAGGADRRRQVERVLDECSLSHMARRHIGTLSKGYRQRVGLAQALLCEPQVLILDEPTIGLDPHQLIDMRELIKSLGGKTTVLLSSHILAEVAQVCHRVVIIDKGQILAEDTPAGLSQRLQSATRTRLRVAGPVEDIQTALRALPGVSEVILQDTPQDTPQDGPAEDQQPGHLFLVHSQDRTLNHELAELVVGRGWSLHELNPLTAGLEELFVRLTTEEQRPAA